MKWISVRKQLPQDGELCLIYDKNELDIFLARYEGNKQWDARNRARPFHRYSKEISYWISFKDIGLKQPIEFSNETIQVIGNDTSIWIDFKDKEKA